jgi:hypothetical protein
VIRLAGSVYDRFQIDSYCRHTSSFPSLRLATSVPRRPSRPAARDTDRQVWSTMAGPRLSPPKNGDRSTAAEDGPGSRCGAEPGRLGRPGTAVTSRRLERLLGSRHDDDGGLRQSAAAFNGEGSAKPALQYRE